MSSNTSIAKKAQKRNTPKLPSCEESEGADVAALIRFLRELKVPKLLSSLPDSRQQGKTSYDLSSLMMWALTACMFRAGSKNAFQSSLKSLSPSRRQGLLNLLQVDEDRLPHSTTVDHTLAEIPLEQLNQIPTDLVKQLLKRKLFYNHAEQLSGNALRIGVDGFWVHKYDRPHAANEDGSNACPHCLPRRQFKGTDKEKTQWVHVMVTFVLIFDGFTLPLLAHPLKIGQVDPEQPDEALKEECELKAAQEILPMLRAAFPRTPILFLGDALYANRPMIRLLEQLGIDYIIVLKENCLKKLNAQCDQLAKTEIYQQHHTRKIRERSEQGVLGREAAWFNHADAGEDIFTNVLRYRESFEDKEGVSSLGYRGAWICSKKLSMGNCFKTADVGRMRWKHEDMHNTAKNRGYEMKHDMARANPNLLFVWKLINFIAIFLFTLFQQTTAAQRSRKSRSWKKFARDLLEQLINISWALICQSPMLFKTRVQFRYQFGLP